MERLTKRTYCGTPDFLVSKETINDSIARSAFYAKVAEKLAYYEELDESGKLIILPCKVGSKVKYKKNHSDISIVNAITIYDDGRISYSFHDYGIKETLVDEWSEDDPEKYEPCTD